MSLHSPSKQRGMTLMELMVVMALVAIISTMAVSTYRSYLLRANRTEATTWLMRVQVAQEKFFLQNKSYADDVADLGVPANTPGGLYKLTISNFSPTTYTANAIAQAGQLADASTCQTFSISEDGSRTPADSTKCWR